MRRFADLEDGGRQLAPVVAEILRAADGVPMVLGVSPNGMPAGRQVAAALGVEVQPIHVERTDDGVRLTEVPEASGRVVVVCDDGVETGTAAHVIGSTLRAVGPARLVLAVPVCPREALANLQHVYDEVIALDTPLVRRSLGWHYEQWPPS
jgi:predicted phosphoribosyltransferase